MSGEAERDARLDNLVERAERAAEGCLDCKVGEPHMCPAVPEPREDVAVEACPECGHSIDNHSPGAGCWKLVGCLCRLKPSTILAERVRAAAIEAWDKGFDHARFTHDGEQIGTRTDNPYRADRRAER